MIHTPCTKNIAQRRPMRLLRGVLPAIAMNPPPQTSE